MITSPKWTSFRTFLRLLSGCQRVRQGQSPRLNINASIWCLTLGFEASYMDTPRDFTTAIMSSRSRFMVSRYHLLVIAALGAGERAHLAGAVRRHDRRLVPVEDVTA